MRALGYEVIGQEGSHILLRRNGAPITVPRHGEIKKGLLRAIITEAGITVEEFNALK